MARSVQGNVLDRFRRYQHLLMYGGGIAITAVVLAAFVIDTVSTVRAYIAFQHQEVSLNANRLRDLYARNATLVRNNIRVFELAWEADEQADQALVDQFNDNGQVLRLQAHNQVPVIVVGARFEVPPEASLRRYIRLAEQMSRELTVAAERNRGILSSWLYSPDRKLVILVATPWPGDARMGTLLSNQAGLLAALAGPRGNPIDPDSSPLDDPAVRRGDLRWLPSYESPLSGNATVRVAVTMFDDKQKPFGLAVYELPVAFLTDAMGQTGFDGSLLLFAREGAVITSASRQPIDPQALDAAHAFRAKEIDKTTDASFRDGHVLFGWPIGETGATLVFVESWRAIAKAVGGLVGVSAATTGLIIVVVWVLILLFDRRVFRPVIDRSRRVFESEHLSRTLVETAPVALGLIAVESGEALLLSPMMVEAASKVVVPARTLRAELIARYRQRSCATASHTGVVQDAWTVPTREGGTMDLSVSVVPARYQGQDVLVSAFTDVTAEKQLERQLREAKRAADSANAAKSAFLAAMSHEIRTPLNAIMGNLELLSHSALDALQRDRLKTIRNSSDGLLSIVSDVLDFSKIEAGEMTLERIAFDAQEVASRSLTMFGPVARAKGLRLSGEFGTVTTQPMQGDPVRLGQVMNNLLSNAIKFTEHGEVTLRMSTEQATGETQSDALMIEVQDSGIGMSAEQQALLFQAFSQVDTTIGRRFGGTGLGLALCARLTGAMGGTIAVHSEAGEGSRFTVRVPLANRDGRVAADVPQFSGERVLFVAASDAWHAYAVGALEAWGLEVQAYRHPAQLDPDTLEEADTLILCGERDTWHADDERELLESASWMIDCSPDGPAYPVATGLVVKVSVYGLNGLATALRYTLLGEALAADRQAQRVLSHRLRVLVAEDNAVNRELFSEQLKLLGCDAQVAEDGRQALAYLERERFDVLLTDLAMPVLDGYGLAREARSRWPEMPVVAATASATLEERLRCEAAGIARMVTKPLPLEELSATLSAVTGVPGIVAVAAEEVEKRSEGRTAGRHDVLDGRAVPEQVQITFLATCEASLAVLQEAYEADDPTRVFAELHSLRGALSVFGYDTLAEQCAQMKSAISRNGLHAEKSMIDLFDCQVRLSILADESDLREIVMRIFQLAEQRGEVELISEVAGFLRSLGTR